MNKEFQVHMLNELGKTKARDIAQAFDDCLARLTTTCPPGREALAVDHDHETNRVRGLLCAGCNTAIGALTSTHLREAAVYVDRHAIDWP